MAAVLVAAGRAVAKAGMPPDPVTPTPGSPMHSTPEWPRERSSFSCAKWPV